MRYKNAVYVVLFLKGCRYKGEGGVKSKDVKARDIISSKTQGKGAG